MRMFNPPHPGAFVRTEVIEPLGLTVSALPLWRLRYPPHAVGVPQRSLWPIDHVGSAYRESLRRQDGHAHAHAGFFRHSSSP